MSEPAASNSSAEMDNREALLQIVNTPMLSQCVYVAAKLRIADLLKDGPRSSDELAAATQVHARSLYRILRALAGFGIFAEGEERRFTLTPMAEQLRDVPGSARGWWPRPRRHRRPCRGPGSPRRPGRLPGWHG